MNEVLAVGIAMIVGAGLMYRFRNSDAVQRGAVRGNFFRLFGDRMTSEGIKGLAVAMLVLGLVFIAGGVLKAMGYGSS